MAVVLGAGDGGCGEIAVAGDGGSGVRGRWRLWWVWEIAVVVGGAVVGGAPRNCQNIYFKFLKMHQSNFEPVTFDDSRIFNTVVTWSTF